MWVWGSPRVCRLSEAVSTIRNTGALYLPFTLQLMHLNWILSNCIEGSAWFYHWILSVGAAAIFTVRHKCWHVVACRSWASPWICRGNHAIGTSTALWAFTAYTWPLICCQRAICPRLPCIEIHEYTYPQLVAQVLMIIWIMTRRWNSVSNWMLFCSVTHHLHLWQIRSLLFHLCQN